MILWQEVLEGTNSPKFCWKSTNNASFSIGIYECIFHWLCVWYNFCSDFYSKTAFRPPGVPQKTIGGPRTTVWKTLHKCLIKLAR
jgi:hypothetical protein